LVRSNNYILIGMSLKSLPISLLIWLLISPILLCAQEENIVVQQSKNYLDINIRCLDKYSHRLQHQQERLIKNLKRKEHRFARKLQRNDSASYASYQEQTLTYDSIGKLIHPDSATLVGKFRRKSNNIIDSLKGVQSFLQSKSSHNDNLLQGYDSKLDNVNSELNYHSYINDLISARTKSLYHIGGSTNSDKISILTGIKKQVFYSNSKMKVYKDIADKPSKVEEMALEYLQGTPGFSQHLNRAMSGIPIANNFLDQQEMEQMGFQTRKKMQTHLTQQFGKNTNLVTKKIGSQIKDHQDKINGLVKDAKETKKTVGQIKRARHSSFKINPMRELPFWKRIDKQYSWQTSRATIDGKPAMLEAAATAGFKHTPRITYGIGLSTVIGLGQNWNNIHFSWRGIGLRSYASWEWQFGINIYAGYERMYKKATFSNAATHDSEYVSNSHSTSKWNESALFGLTKSYYINSKWNGTIQVLYDIWWQQKELRSPIVLRFTIQAK